MEPALDILHRSLRGDPGAISFLDRTTSIYVLDATDISMPKTYGCWNFIHQAINEIERAEAASPSIRLSPHLQLLANIALRVARRSNELDKKLMFTCINNAAKYQGPPNEAQRLIDINVEIRDIVMGRIAALALDPSFHRYDSSSAFSDTVAMELFCAVLAANAVSNGPEAVNHLVSEWILPSAVNLPRFCLSCVTLHLALEACRKSAPAGTQDMLQKISSVVMAGVLAPVLNEVIKESSSSEEKIDDCSSHERNSRIAALSLRAIDRWCEATDLSLAQIRHVCNKVHINIVDLLSDAMYSDSRLVLDALAELIEAVVSRHQVPSVSDERMTQVQYIMQVDEVAFRSNITKEQLVAIESKEMVSILEELVSAIGLQRFRFIDRQISGDEDVCRSLTRIASSVCMACACLSNDGQQLNTGPGLLDLLLKAASHPSINICGIAIDVLGELVSSENGITNQLLPILQRRAITPHHFENNVLSLEASDICSVNYHEFENFRLTVLTDALIACFKCNEENYMTSCTAAIEEFCAATSSVEVSFHLEAALYCIGSVSDKVIGGSFASSHIASVKKCIKALSEKPSSLKENPLTLSQANIFVQKYIEILDETKDSNALDLASDLALSTFTLCASNFPKEPASIEVRREANTSPYSESSKALKILLCHAPKRFVSNRALAALGAAWEASYSAANTPGIVSTDDRMAICIGICHVLAQLPRDQHDKSLLALAMPAIDCFETMVRHVNTNPGTVDGEQMNTTLERIASELTIITTMAITFSNANALSATSRSPMEIHSALVEPSLSLLKRAWSSIIVVASSYNYHESVSRSLSYFLTSCIPPDCNDDNSLELIKELCAVATSIMQSDSSKGPNFESILNFLEEFVRKHGSVIDKNTRIMLQGQFDPTNAQMKREQDMNHCLERLILSTIDSINQVLGSTWTSQRQGNGQPAFETKVSGVDDERRKNSNKALASMFSLLRVCAEQCPIFLLHLPAGPGLDRNENRLLERAVEATVVSLLEPDLDTSNGAIMLLDVTVVLTQSFSDDVRDVAEDILARVRSNIVKALIVGGCGKLNSSTLENASRLLRRLLIASPSSDENISTLAQSVSDESIFLGPAGRETALQFLLQSSRNQNTDEDVSEFFHDIWQLHQIDTMESLRNSDAVLRFCKKYTPTPPFTS